MPPVSILRWVGLIYMDISIILLLLALLLCLSFAGQSILEHSMLFLFLSLSFYCGRHTDKRESSVGFCFLFFVCKNSRTMITIT